MSPPFPSPLEFPAAASLPPLNESSSNYASFAFASFKNIEKLVLLHSKFTDCPLREPCFQIAHCSVDCGLIPHEHNWDVSIVTDAFLSHWISWPDWDLSVWSLNVLHVPADVLWLPPTFQKHDLKANRWFQTSLTCKAEYECLPVSLCQLCDARVTHPEYTLPVVTGLLVKF